MSRQHQQRIVLAAQWVLRRILSEDRFDEIAPDLMELYIRRSRSGMRLAGCRYALDAASVAWRRSLRKSRVRRKHQNRPHGRGPVMLKNYALVALRQFRKQKGYTFINAVGLGIGLASCFFILLFLQNEQAYDRDFRDADRIYRVTANYVDADRHWAPIGPPTGLQLQDEMPEIEEMTRFFPSESPPVFRHGDARFEETDGGFADSTFLSFFGIPLEEGDPERALAAPGQIVVSHRMAQKYFGDEPALGQTINMDEEWDVTISGVMAPATDPTHLPIDFLLSMSTFYQGNEEWLAGARTWAGFLTYIKLSDVEARAPLESRLADFADRFMDGVFEEPGSEVVRYELQPLTDIHLHSHLEKEYRANGDIAYVYTFSIVALFILIVACINFINLATARASNRMREVAIRKTFGAQKMQLTRQYLGESLALSFLGFGLAVSMILAFLPAFNQLTGENFAPGDVLMPAFVGTMLLVTIVTGLAAGLYPAFLLSSFRPAVTLRGSGGGSGHRAILRKGLVVFQFSISIVLIAGSAIIWQQLDYFRTRALGFDKEHVMVVDLPSEVHESVNANPESVKEELRRDPSILSVSHASDYPGERYSLETVTTEGTAEDVEAQMRIAWRTDYDYVSALNLEIVEGRDFSEFAPADTSGWLINESAVRRLGLERPIDTVLRWGDYSGPIIGVVRDFNFASLRNEIEPLVIPLRPEYGGRLLIRYEASDPRTVSESVLAAMNRVFPGSYFTYSFLDDTVNAQYADEERLRDVLGIFTAIAVLVACLGLFGLAAHTAERRRAEIGVRKVLGASAASIARLFIGDFALLVGLALLIAVPVAWIGAHRWLAGFAFRIEVNPLTFLLSGLVAGLVAVVTVAVQASRAARTDPVKTIRNA